MPFRTTNPQASPQPKSKTPEKLAEAPFNDPEVDLMLRSSDEVHFHVVKKILTLASPVFADMFSNLPPPSQKSHHEVQVVPLPEHSTILDLVLRHIYPVRNPKTDTLHNANVLAEFARNYEVEALDDFIAGYLTDSVERDPPGVYAIAITYGYKGIGTKAARLCLNLPFSGLQSPYLRCATAEHVSELYRYHVACGEAASALASSDRTWIPLSLFKGTFQVAPTGKGARGAGGGTVACPICTTPDLINQTSTSHDGAIINDDGKESSLRRTGPLCLWSYLYRSALVLAHHPAPEAITGRDFVLKANDCRSCGQYMEGHLLELSVVFEGQIKKAIEQVSLSLYPSLCCLQGLTVHAHTLQVPLPKAVSLRPSSNDTISN
jgi:BTB/POZ domain-containing protein